MLIVAVDTSGRKGSIALCRGDGGSFEVLQLISLEGGTYSAELMPRIAEALKLHKLDKTQVDGFVVVSGPGSFTGLRVGLATVKGLCEVLVKPLATVSMLEALALVHGRDGQTVSAILDAGRGEIYVGEYQVSAGRASAVREYIVKLDQFASEAAGTRGGLFTPDAKVAEALQTGNAGAKLIMPIHADEIGRIGIRKLLAGETADPASIDVNYIRRSDAEMLLGGKTLMVVLIRPATPQDIPAIRALEQQSESAAHWAEREYDALFAPDAPTRIALVAVDEADLGQVRGFVITRCALEDWEIENVVVAREAQRHGVGTKLIRELLRCAHAAAATSVLLEVRESNLAARKLYERLGFNNEG